MPPGIAMPEKSIFADMLHWFVAIGAWAGGMISTLALAFVNRGPALQSAISAQVATILAADNDRLKQMSDALDGQSHKIDTLLTHVSALEAALSRAGLAIPPRPALERPAE